MPALFTPVPRVAAAPVAEDPVMVKMDLCSSGDEEEK